MQVTPTPHPVHDTQIGKEVLQDVKVIWQQSSCQIKDLSTARSGFRGKDQ